MSRLECAAGVILNHRLSALVYFHPGPLTVIAVCCVVVHAGVCVRSVTVWREVSIDKDVWHCESGDSNEIKLKKKSSIEHKFPSMHVSASGAISYLDYRASDFHPPSHTHFIPDMLMIF